MDLNYLLSRQQVSLVRADTAACPEARFAHRALAHAYAERIRVEQTTLGASHPASLLA
jgi:hypothetical protein